MHGMRSGAAWHCPAAPAEATFVRVPLLEPKDGLRPLVPTDHALAEATDQLRAGTGPVAVDAERASGFRYGHRAFLVQLRRRGGRSVLIDPVAHPPLSDPDGEGGG